MILRVQNYNKRNKQAIPELWKLLPLAKFFSKSLVDSKIISEMTGLAENEIEAL